MLSVTQRIKYVKQPKGGYLPLKLFTKSFINNDNEFINNDGENIHSSLIGLSVDYLTRYLISEHLKMTGIKKVGCPFFISFTGASNLDTIRGIDTSSEDSEFLHALYLLSGINTTLDDTSIINACR